MTDMDAAIDAAIAVLNQALEADPEAVAGLVNHRVPCNAKLAAHPTIQVGPDGVGLLGILNGLFGADPRGWGFICAVLSEDGTILRFERTPG